MELRKPDVRDAKELKGLILEVLEGHVEGYWQCQKTFILGSDMTFKDTL